MCLSRDGPVRSKEGTTRMLGFKILAGWLYVLIVQYSVCLLSPASRIMVSEAVRKLGARQWVCLYNVDVRWRV